ncbi:MAG: PPK2 family polyphosphate kinase [Paracoccaceae bacterium]
MARTHDIAERYRVSEGHGFRLDRVDPAGAPASEAGRAAVAPRLAANAERLGKLQERLFAEGRRSVLLVLQAMDAGGKDSAIRHVLRGINPQGCEVRAFEAPGPAERRHDFLRRQALARPARGHIGVFNRSHYEEVLIVRVHPRFLEAQNLPPAAWDDPLWAERFEAIRVFEDQLVRAGTAVLKVFLHVSRAEQARRLLARIERPEKNWKFAAADVEERAHWDAYMAAYQDAIRATARPHAPWLVVPADDKWHARLAISEALKAELERLDPRFPTLGEAERRRMAEARATLRRELGEDDAARRGG